MRLHYMILTFVLGIASVAWAKDVKLPEDKPALTLMLPDDWSPKAYENGYEATSPDAAMYVSVEPGDAKDLSAMIAKSIKAIAAKGVELDPKSQKKSEGEVKGMKMVDVGFTGKYKDADTSVALTIFVVNSEKVVLFTFWGSEQAQKANAAGLEAIQNSVKPAS